MAKIILKMVKKKKHSKYPVRHFLNLFDSYFIQKCSFYYIKNVYV